MYSYSTVHAAANRRVAARRRCVADLGTDQTIPITLVMRPQVSQGRSRSQPVLNYEVTSVAPSTGELPLLLYPRLCNGPGSQSSSLACQVYADVFFKFKASELPPNRDLDHAVDLMDQANPPYGPIYNLSEETFILYSLFKRESRK